MNRETDELQLIGIISEKKLEQYNDIHKDELHRIIYDALSIGPIYQAIIDDLESKG